MTRSANEHVQGDVSTNPEKVDTLAPPAPQQPFSRWGTIRKALQRAADIAQQRQHREVLSAQLDYYAHELEKELNAKAAADTCPCPDCEAVRDLATSRAAVSALTKGIAAVSELIDNSHGVAGLHLNGDVASWEELRTGGRFEQWLCDFDAAVFALTPPTASTEGARNGR